MGIQGREYMRERSRRAAHQFEYRRDPPFTPPQAGASILVIVLTWIAAASALYVFYQWLAARHDGAPPSGHKVVVANTQRERRESEQQSLIERSPGPTEMPSVAPVQRLNSPAVRPQPVQQDRRETYTPQTGGTIYLCKSYDGGTFWAQSHCAQHHALIDSIVPVPTGLPFEQQVQLAEQRRQRTALADTSTPTVDAKAAGSGNGECKALDARVEQLDAMARQPQPAQMQDWIRGQRQEARDRQFALHC